MYGAPYGDCDQAAPRETRPTEVRRTPFTSPPNEIARRTVSLGSWKRTNGPATVGNSVSDSLTRRGAVGEAIGTVAACDGETVGGGPFASGVQPMATSATNPNAAERMDNTLDTSP